MPFEYFSFLMWLSFGSRITQNCVAKTVLQSLQYATLLILNEHTLLFRFDVVLCSTGQPSVLRTALLPSRLGKSWAPPSMGECPHQHGSGEEYSPGKTGCFHWQARHGPKKLKAYDETETVTVPYGVHLCQHGRLEA